MTERDFSAATIVNGGTYAKSIVDTTPYRIHVNIALRIQFSIEGVLFGVAIGLVPWS